MKQNVGNADKVVRYVVGFALLSLLFILKGDIRWIGLIGLAPLVTALAGWCPGWAVLGINTCKTGPDKPA